MTPASERKAKERQAKREAGLVPVEVWLPREAVQSFRSMAERTTQTYLLTRQVAESPKEERERTDNAQKSNAADQD